MGQSSKNCVAVIYCFPHLRYYFKNYFNVNICKQIYKFKNIDFLL